MKIAKIPLTPISYPTEASVGKTGLWRYEKPIIDYEKCIKCMLCWMYCPDVAVLVRDDGYPEINYDYCKGCGICVNECPVKAIRVVREIGES